MGENHEFTKEPDGSTKISISRFSFASSTIPFFQSNFNSANARWNGAIVKEIAAGLPSADDRHPRKCGENKVFHKLSKEDQDTLCKKPNKVLWKETRHCTGDMNCSKNDKGIQNV